MRLPPVRRSSFGIRRIDAKLDGLDRILHSLRWMVRHISYSGSVSIAKIGLKAYRLGIIGNRMLIVAMMAVNNPRL